MKRIVVAGASTYGVKNLGDDAMFCNLVTGLRRHLPDCRITFLARHPHHRFDQEFGVQSIKNFDHDSKAQSLGRWFWGFNPGDPTDHLRDIRQAIEECDLLVIGGNSFMEVSENDFLRGVASYSALLAIWARLLQKPYVLYGVAGHPLEGVLTKQVARFLCGNAGVVTVREEFTRQQLVNAGVDEGNIRVLADPAFGLDPNWDRDLAWNILDREGIRFSSDAVVGIGFRHMYWKWSEPEAEGYARKMAQLCDFMVKTFGVDLLFIPNCTYHVDTPNEDDRVIGRTVINHMRESSKAHLICGEYTLQETLSLFSLLDLHVSNRRHSCISAALHHVPIVSMSSGHLWHFNPFLEALGIPGQVMNFTEGSLASLQDKVSETWGCRSAVTHRIIQVLPTLRKQAHRHVEFLVEFMVRDSVMSDCVEIGV